ncbi:MAG: hypothetical protein GX758_00025 [Tenericutes bacterium]|nr:hypothetical protein [Mycoplasmatota bacterium]
MKRRSKITLKIILGVIVLIMALLGALNLYNSLYNMLYKTDYSKIFGYSNHIVFEDNLLPKYKMNDVVILKEEFSYSVGEVILFKYYDSYKLAEITDISAGKYTVIDKTDSINQDYDLSFDLIVGKAVFNLKSFGKLYDIITSPYAFVFIAFFIAGYFLLTSQIKIKEI